MTLSASVTAAASSSIVLRSRCPLYPLVLIAALERRVLEFQAQFARVMPRVIQFGA